MLKRGHFVSKVLIFGTYNGTSPMALHVPVACCYAPRLTASELSSVRPFVTGHRPPQGATPSFIDFSISSHVISWPSSHTVIRRATTTFTMQPTSGFLASLHIVIRCATTSSDFFSSLPSLTIIQGAVTTFTIHPPTMAPMVCATMYAAPVMRLRRPATSKAKVTAGLTCPPEIGWLTATMTPYAMECATAIARIRAASYWDPLAPEGGRRKERRGKLEGGGRVKYQGENGEGERKRAKARVERDGVPSSDETFL